MSVQSLDRARRLSLGEQLARHARVIPGATAFVFDGKRLSYGELEKHVTAVAGGLAARGVRTGDRIAVLMTNRFELIEAYLAACRLGAICVPVNFRLAAPEIAYILQDSGAKALIVDDGLASIATKVRSRSSGTTRGDRGDVGGEGARVRGGMLRKHSGGGHASALDRRR